MSPDTLQAKIASFQKKVWDFYRKNRRDFPWRNTQNAYHILVSEIMLQQTQADRVVPFYKKWIARFPDIASLAGATFSKIYPYWQGLGYNRRALALQKTAQKIATDFAGNIPKDVVVLQTLPGIGPYTACAVSIFAYNTPVACIETNIRRVFIHEFFPRKKNVSDDEILKIAKRALPPKKSREWHWALMDYGAYLKTSTKNPNHRAKNYAVQSKFEGSARQIRGAILRELLAKPMSATELVKIIGKDTKKTKEIIEVLESEHLIKQHKKKYSLN